MLYLNRMAEESPETIVVLFALHELIARMGGAATTEKELELAMSKAHVPNHLLRMHSAIVNKAGLNPILQTTMDGNIVSSIDTLVCFDIVIWVMKFLDTFFC